MIYGFFQGFLRIVHIVGCLKSTMLLTCGKRGMSLEVSMPGSKELRQRGFNMYVRIENHFLRPLEENQKLPLNGWLP